MSSIRTQWDDAVWFNFYPTTSPSTYVSLKAQNKIRISQQSAATTYTATDIYPIGTRLKVMNANTNKYGTVASLSSSSTAVILTMTMDSGTLTSTITTVSRSIITPNNSPIPGGALGFTAATQAQMEAGTSLVVGVTPGRQQYHLSAAKAWVLAATNGTTPSSYNVTSVGDTGLGIVTINFTVSFSAADYTVAIGVDSTVTDGDTSTIRILQIRSGKAAGSFICDSVNGAAGHADPNYYAFACFGDL